MQRTPIRLPTVPSTWPLAPLAVLLAMLAGGAGAARAQPGAPPADTLSALLAYPAQERPLPRVLAEERRGGVVVQDVQYPSVAGGEPVSAYLVRPVGEGAGRAAILYVHWYKPGAASSNRTQFLAEAEALARRGVVSLLVSTMWAAPEWYRRRRWEDDFESTVRQARELRRALDVLAGQPDVDTSRIGYVGHDFGAMFGALLAAVERRPRAYALIAGASRFPDWYLFDSASGKPEGEALAAFRERFRVLDPVEVIGRAGASLYFQYGEADEYTPRPDFVALYLAAPEDKRISTYASGHAMDARAIRADRVRWLAERLGVAPAADR